MSLLALDSSTQTSGLALYDGVRVLYERTWTGPGYHGVELAPGIEEMLATVGMKAEDLEAVAVAIGPGSYTGLRIGLAIAKGLVFTHGLALIPVPTLDIVAAGQPVSDLPLVAVLQAGRKRLGVGRYVVKNQGWVSKGKPELMTAAELVETINEPTLVAGELSEEDRKVLGRRYKNALIQSPAWSLRRPAVLAEIGWARWKAGEFGDTKGLGPDYIQSIEAEA